MSFYDSRLLLTTRAHSRHGTASASSLKLNFHDSLFHTQKFYVSTISLQVRSQLLNSFLYLALNLFFRFLSPFTNRNQQHKYFAGVQTDYIHYDRFLAQMWGWILIIRSIDTGLSKSFTRNWRKNNWYTMNKSTLKRDYAIVWCLAGFHLLDYLGDDRSITNGTSTGITED